MDNIEDIRRQEGLAICDHLPAIKEILETKCRRCMACNRFVQCMGCAYDSIDGFGTIIEDALKTGKEYHIWSQDDPFCSR